MVKISIYTKICKKLKIQSLVTDTKGNGEARTVLPIKATVLTQTKGKRKDGVHSTANEGDHAHLGFSREEKSR